MADKALIWSALLVGTGFYVLLNMWGLILTDGQFVYPLDDTYIHLSMAEQISRGEYGINPGAFAPAASSVIYPLLLVPFAGSALHQFLPLIINAAALFGGLVLMVRILDRIGYGADRVSRNLAIFVLVVAPVSMNMIGVAMLGMEQILHVLTVLGALYGVVLWHETRRVNGYLAAAILLGPLVRFEATGLSLLLSAMIFLEGRKRAGLALALGAVLPLIGFSWFLYTNDGVFLPNSVVRKIILAKTVGGEDASLLLKNFNGGDYELVAWVFLAAAAGFAVLLMQPSIRSDKLALRLGIIAFLSLLGQVFIGRNGWGNRHETYVIVLAVLALIIVLRGVVIQNNRRGLLGRIVVVAVLLMPLPHFATQSITFGPLSMRNIYDQQWQMGRFARDYLDAPVAVNDIGLPSYRNNNKVLDLWGLASTKALKAWAKPEPRGWVNELAAREGSDLAMVYQSWILPAVGSGWTKIGYLKIRGRRYAVAGAWVTFYATNPSAIPKLQGLMRDFQATLPNPAMLEILETPVPFNPETEDKE